MNSSSKSKPGPESSSPRAFVDVGAENKTGPGAGKTNMRYVSNFSCGAASAVATKITLAEQSNVVIVNAFIQEEHEDNRRFLADCEKWFGREITVLRDEKYNASTFEVWRQKRYIKGRDGAPCSKALKRDVLAGTALPLFGDITVIGYTVEEQDRADILEDLYPQERFSFILIEKGLTKKDCLAMVDRAGILLPLPYRQGFDNGNCLNCPKGGQNYWQHIRHYYPENFVKMSELQKELGPGSYFLQFRSGSRKGERMSLEELPAGLGNMADEPSFACSHLCESTEALIAISGNGGKELL